MAIKINWKDLQKRIINGKEVEKVILNWVQIWPESSPVIVWAWSYWNQSLGLISVSADGTNWTTVADKNLGASNARQDWATLGEINCGSYFQRWNNYFFPWTGDVTYNSDYTVNISNYWPDNYYSWSTFSWKRNWWIEDPRWNWGRAENLRGYTTGTNVARKWPCATWFHIPTLNEFINLCAVFWWLQNYGSNGPTIRAWLLLPFAWTRSSANHAPTQWQGSNTTLRTCDYYMSSNTSYSNCVVINNDTYNNISLPNQSINIWASIRPFKNEPVVPDSTWTVLYQPNN